MTRREVIGWGLLTSPLVVLLVAAALELGVLEVGAFLGIVFVALVVILTGVTLISDEDPEDSDFALVRLVAVPIVIVRWYRIIRGEDPTAIRKACIKTAWGNAWNNVYP